MPSPATAPVIEVSASDIESPSPEDINDCTITSTGLKDTLAPQVEDAAVEESIGAPARCEVGIVRSANTPIDRQRETDVLLR